MCHLPPQEAVRAHPATVGSQCWPPPLRPQAEKLFELSWMWSFSKSSQFCFFKEEKTLKHPNGSYSVIFCPSSVWPFANPLPKCEVLFHIHKHSWSVLCERMKEAAISEFSIFLPLFFTQLIRVNITPDWFPSVGATQKNFCFRWGKQKNNTQGD